MLEESQKKLNFNLILNTFSFINEYDEFNYYIREVYNGLLKKSDNISKGINKSIFLTYFNLSGYINNRIFEIFDRDKNKYISQKEFIYGMNYLFTSSYENQIKLTFEIFDIDNNNIITKEDIQSILSYLPIINKDSSFIIHFKYYNFTINDQIESQKEIIDIINNLFRNKTQLDYYEYKRYIELYGSECFLYLLIYLLIHKPFSYFSITAYRKYLTNKQIKSKNNIDNENLISFPIINNTIFMYTKYILIILDYIENNINISYFEKNNEKLCFEYTITEEETNIINLEKITNINKIFNRKLNEKEIIIKYFEEKVGLFHFYEGILLKQNKDNFQFNKLFYRIYGNDMFYYKYNTNNITFVGFKSLKCCFVEKEETKKIENISYFCLSLIWFNYKKKYYFNIEEERDNWYSIISNITNTKSFDDFYLIKERFDKRTLFSFYTGFHIKNKKQICIKRYSKQKLTHSDYEEILQEIEILKLIKHPFTLRIYDIIENAKYIYIVTEYLDNINLYKFFEMRKFNISEELVSDIINKISNTIYYLHYFSICHRDISVYNILMTNYHDLSDIKLINFQFSDFIGPNEFNNKIIGTQVSIFK